MEFGGSSIVKQFFEFPFWTTFMIYTVAMTLKTSDELFLGDQGHVRELGVLGEYLYRLDKRWRIAGMRSVEIMKVAYLIMYSRILSGET